MLNRILQNQKILILIKVILLLVGYHVLSSCQSKSSKLGRDAKRANSDSAKVDSVFAAHFDILASFAKGQYKNVTVEKINLATAFLEAISGIESQREGTRIGKLYSGKETVREDLEKWQTWYIKNRLKLKWDSKAQKVVFVENQ